MATRAQVTRSVGCVSWASGLDEAAVGEIILSDHDEVAIVAALERDSTRLHTLHGRWAPGVSVRSTGGLLSFCTGESLLGRVIDPTGRPLDGGAAPAGLGALAPQRPLPPIPPVDQRQSSIWTGIVALDLFFGLRRGADQTLFGGDRGARHALVRELLARCTRAGTFCVLGAVGWTADELSRTRDFVAAHGAPERFAVVAALADESPALQRLVGLAAVAAGEGFSRQGRDTLVLWDDLDADARADFALAGFEQAPLVAGLPVGFEARRASVLSRAHSVDSFAPGGALTVCACFDHRSDARPQWSRPAHVSALTSFEVLAESPGFLPEFSFAHLRDRPPSAGLGSSTRQCARALRATLLRAHSEALALRVAPTLAAAVDPQNARRSLRVREALRQPSRAVVEPWQALVLTFALSRGPLAAVPLANVRGAVDRLLTRAREVAPSLVKVASQKLTPELEATLDSLCNEVFAEPAKPEPVKPEPTKPEPMPEAGMSRAEFEAFLARVAEQQPEFERVGPAHYVFWVPTVGAGIDRPGRRPITALARVEDDLALLIAPIDTFRGERSVATALLRRNTDSALYTRSALMGELLCQFYACKLKHLVANEWLAAFREVQEQAELRAKELGELSVLYRPAAPAPVEPDSN